MKASGTDVPGTDRGEALYFFPDVHMTAAELATLLREGSLERRAWAVSHLLRYADWEDIWTWVSRDTVRELFPRLELPERLRLAWARMLKLESATAGTSG